MNPIFGKHISRRTLLRGVGASMSLPILTAMQPALGGERLTAPPLRTAFMFVPNGVRPDHWTPPGDDEQFELTPMLKSMDKVKNNFSLIENLWNKQTVGRNGHWPKVPAYLAGGYVVRTAGRDIDTGGTSLDQVLAQRFGDQTPLPSLELGVDEAYTGVDNVGGGFTRIYGSHIAWRDPHTPIPKEIVPRLAFDRLFRNNRATPVSGFTTKHPDVINSLNRDETSVLDLVLNDARDLKRKIGYQDQQKVDEYLEAVRAVEVRIDNSLKPQKRWINDPKFDVARPQIGIPGSHEEHVRQMLDIMVLAFWTDTTRVSTFMFGNAQAGRDFSFLEGVKGSFHSISHHLNEPKNLDVYEKICTWHVEQFAYFLEKMQSLDENGTSLLDNSMVTYGATIRDGNKHDEKNLPLILAGKGKGTLNPGRRIRYKPDTPLCNLYLTMLNIHGCNDKAFGDSTGPLENL
jgi:hypothetical protein